LNLRKKVVVIAAAISICLLSFTAYTARIYYSMYLGVRTFQVELKSFNTRILDDTGQSLTEVTISNPTEFTFNVDSIFETLYLGDEFFLSKLWLGHPTKIGPEATIDMSNTLDIPETKIPLINGTGQLQWTIELEIVISSTFLSTSRLVFVLYPE
jgi:hypothetical protein